MDDGMPIEEKLPYQTRTLVFPDETSVEEFMILDEDKEIVLAQLYPFSPIPKLTDVVYDLHANKTFFVKDFRVTWEQGMNYLVIPYYSERGDTVIDCVGENAWSVDESDEFDDPEKLNDDASPL